MIYNLVLRGEYITHFEIKWDLDRAIVEYVLMCVDEENPAIFVSTDNVYVIIPYEVLSNNIIEVYENESGI